MNKKLILLSLFCILSCQNTFKNQFFRNLQDEPLPPLPLAPPPPPPPPQLPPNHGDFVEPPGDLPPDFQDDPPVDPLPEVPFEDLQFVEIGDGSGQVGPLEVLPPAPPNFDGMVLEIQNEMVNLDGQINQNVIMSDSPDIDVSIDAANKLVELNFEKEKLNRKIFEIKQEKENYGQKKAFNKAQKDLSSAQNKLNHLLGPNYQNLQEAVQKQLQKAQSPERISEIIASAQIKIDALILKAQELNNNVSALLTMFKNNQIDNLNKNIEVLSKDNSSSTIISPTQKADITASINGMKSQIEILKKEIASVVLEKGVRAKQIADIKVNFSSWSKQVQDNQAVNAQINAAFQDVQKCVNDNSLQNQQNQAQQLLEQSYEQLKDPNNGQDQINNLNGQIEDLKFKIQASYASQIKQFLSCNELKFALAQKQEANSKVQQAQLEKAKAGAITQQEKDFIVAQQEKSRQGLVNVQEQLKQIAQEKIDLNAKLAAASSTQFVQDANVRQNRADIENLGQQLKQTHERIQGFQQNFQEQLNNNAYDCKKRIGIIQNQLGNMKEFQEIVNNAKAINDKFNALGKAFVDSSNLQANTNIADLNKQLAQFKPTDDKYIAIQKQIAQQTAQLANIKLASLKQVEQFSIQDKNISQIFLNFQNQLNGLLSQNQYQCNNEQLPQLVQQLQELDTKIAQQKQQLASSTISDSEKVNIKISFAQLVLQKTMIINQQNKMTLYLVNQDVNYIGNNIKALTGQIAECSKIPAASRDAATNEKCNSAQAKLDAENAALKQKTAQKASAESAVSANSAGDSQQQKIEEQAKLVKDLNSQIQGLWQKIQMIQQSNQEQVNKAAMAEEKILILQQQLKSTKDIDALAVNLKDLHTKLAAAQKAFFDIQQARFTSNIAELNKALAAATDAQKKLEIQAQIDGLNAFNNQAKTQYTQQSGEIANMIAKIGTFSQNNINLINNAILSNQSQAFNLQIQGYQQQIQEIDNQINNLRGQLAGIVPVPESERQKINDTIASLSKQKVALALSRDQIAVQNAAAVNTLSSSQLKDLTEKLAECKKMLASFPAATLNSSLPPPPLPSPAPPSKDGSAPVSGSFPSAPPTQQQIAEQCNQFQMKLDELNGQVKKLAEQKAQLDSTIGVQSAVVQQQQKIDESNRQLGDLMKQFQGIFSQLQKTRSSNDMQANQAPNCQERVNILKKQLDQQKDIQTFQSQLKDIFGKLPAAQKAVQDNSNAQSAVIIADLTKRIAAQTNVEQKAILQKQLDETNAMQAKNASQFASMAAEQVNQNAMIASLVEVYVGGINNRIAESQSECYKNQMNEYQQQMQALQDQIAQLKGQLATLTSSTEKAKVNFNIDANQVKWNFIKLDYEKVFILNFALINQIASFQLKNLNVQLADCNKILASSKAPSQEQVDKCKFFQGQIDAQNNNLKAQTAQKAQSEQQVTFLSSDVALQTKADESRQQLDEQNKLIKEQQGRIAQYKQKFQAQIDQQQDLNVKISILNQQLANSKDFDSLLAQLKALLDKLPALQKAHGENQNALANARLANINKRIADATLVKADTTELVKQQAEINASISNIKAQIANYSIQVSQITIEASSSVQYQNSIKQQVAINLKANSESVQQAQQQQSEQLQVQIANLDSQISSQQDEKQKNLLFNQKQNLLVQKLQGDNNRCKSFLDSVEGRKLLITAQIAQQQADLTACSAALAANKDATQTAAITERCAGLKAGIEKSNGEQKGVDEQKKKCEEQVANNNVNIDSAQNQQKLQVAYEQIAVLKGNIANGIEIAINAQKIDKINEQIQLLSISQKQIQIKNLPAEIAQLTAQIAAEKDAAKLADLNKQLAQKKSDSSTFVVEVNSFQALMKKKLDEKLAQVQKQINENEVAAKAKIAAQAQADAERLKKETAAQADLLKQNLDKINAKIAAETKLLDQEKYECDLKDKKARQALIDLQNKLIKNVKDADAKKQADLLKQKQDQEAKVAADIKQAGLSKEQQIKQAQQDNTIDGQRKIAIEQIQQV